jgi:hypothetical protein
LTGPRSFLTRPFLTGTAGAPARNGAQSSPNKTKNSLFMNKSVCFCSRLAALIAGEGARGPVGLVEFDLRSRQPVTIPFALVFGPGE